MSANGDGNRRHFDTAALDDLRGHLAHILGIEPDTIGAQVEVQTIVLNAWDAFRLLVLYEAAVTMTGAILQAVHDAENGDDEDG